MSLYTNADVTQYYKNKYKNKYKMSKREIAVKILILRIISSLVTAAIVFFLTGSIGISAAIFPIDFVVKLGLYYYFEIAWLKIRKRWRKKGLEPV